MDVLSEYQRAYCMSSIRGIDTRPEMRVRGFLHRSGYRFVLHDRSLPGRPDLVLPRHQAVVFVHGCFWHRHTNCIYATTPATRRKFWTEKFRRNVERDQMNLEKLRDAGWRVFVVWECGLKHDPEAILKLLARSLKQKRCVQLELPEQPPREMK